MLAEVYHWDVFVIVWNELYVEEELMLDVDHFWELPFAAGQYRSPYNSFEQKI
jgi:hypothetical protein